MDESTDFTDKVQLTCYVRCYVQDKFYENLLGIAALEDRTTSKDILDALVSIVEGEIKSEKFVAITTDGAPIMLGKQSGLVSWLKELDPDICSYHCIIHQIVLCASLGQQYASAMMDVMKTVNYLRAISALHHRKLRAFLQDAIDAKFNDLLLHNNVRWLSKGHVVERFWELREELKELLGQDETVKGKQFGSIFNNQEKMKTIAFLADLTSHLENLNKKLQGKELNICELVSTVGAFQHKLSLFRDNLKAGQLFFSRYKEIFYANNNKLTSHDEFLTK